VHILSHLSALSFVGKDLCLRLCGSNDCGYFVFDSKLVAVVNLVSEQILTSGAMHEKDGFTGDEN